ncbi:AbrB/MazE/SpoVT family DNA-binding domain-containing protein [Aromatoleum anaerobium]|uniref:AbrB/MazE/SpoVT family DNA-binding domain-containing protein n=1 Tax=Aromatoleum anaerobium TaxID=182180 RepID=A0ABX1PRN3_9RHOO|nr:AbrB/MazE/SpoVT family DNA-binding domain-containing protein [Aromatoleum anaerobium]MCK0509409.1 AbrB/MazE/SpoVT family DNA-binding domain-containing protein [Aromatoleum anaerobium]
MPEAILVIKHWGNSLGVRLPAAVAREAHLNADQPVRITVEEGRVVITPLPEDVLTLEQRLARFDPGRHGGEAMVSGNVGAERW